MSGPDTSLVSFDVAGHVARVTLNSPATRNALSRQLLEDLHAAFDRAFVGSTRVVVLDHAPPVFCAGADMKERLTGDIDSTPMMEAMERLMSASQPTIAVVSGPVRAGGVGLMAACDLVVVRPEVTFAFSEVRIGVAPAIISVPLFRRCSPSKLASAFLTGEAFGADAALAMGLVSHVDDDVEACVATLVSGILAGAPEAVRLTKQLLWGAGDGAPRSFAAMQALSDRLFRSEEGQEGMRSFIERRPPGWTTKPSTS
jgi:enoyl-CoA hydratase/carnithine racemase